MVETPGHNRKARNQPKNGNLLLFKEEKQQELNQSLKGINRAGDTRREGDGRTPQRSNGCSGKREEEIMKLL